VPEVPGTESESAAQYLDRVDPTGETVTGVVEGVAVSDPALRAQVERAVADVRDWPGSPPYRTRTRRAASPRRTGRRCSSPSRSKGGLSDDAEEHAVDAAATGSGRSTRPKSTSAAARCSASRSASAPNRTCSAPS
jgi:RND superfamily putative drug exporter